MLHTNKANKSKAEQICAQKYNGFLPYSDVYSHYKQLKVYMQTQGVQKAWLAPEKKTYSKPHWINSTVVGL